MFKISLSLLLLSTAIFADITMCYKENFITPSKIETVNLDGGICDGKFSVNEMKKKRLEY